MCGIVGYVGPNDCVPIIYEGLQRLEYRGYDSAGIAVVENGGVKKVRSVGKLFNLGDKLNSEALKGITGIGHTRWATHGKPTEANAHPHLVEDVVVVHNGIIENYMELRAELTGLGHRFSSETDTEVIPHLIANRMAAGDDFEAAFLTALKKLKGSYAIGAIHAGDPGTVLAARKASPLVLGLGEGENYLASDVPALLSRTRDFIFLEDEDFAVLTESGIRIVNLFDGEVEREIKTVQWSPAMAEKGGYKHFMLKEIFEQPRAITDTLAGRLNQISGSVTLDGGEEAEKIATKLKALHIVACGTSYHAGLVGKYWIEKLARIPVVVDLASEYRYRDPVLNGDTGILLISQSGETADTLAVMAEGKKRGAPILAICNVVGSSLARGADATMYTHAGPEIGVASTKAFTTQLVNLYLMALYLASHRGMLSGEDLAAKIDGLRKVPGMVESALGLDSECERIGRTVVEANSAIFLGRGSSFPIALEGALKLKEISYIHAEGYAAGEMKHGPIALVDGELPVVAVLTKGFSYEKMVSNVEEVRARNGRIIALATEGDERIRDLADEAIYLPDFDEELLPIIATVPMQLLAYHVAVHKGTDVDQPRNLAKSVTVE